MYTDKQMYGLLTKPEPEKIARYDLINKPEPDELYHWGIKGMKWGQRRYQNKDGTLTEEGKARLRKQWTRDPKLVAEHYDDLTPEERQYAIQRRRDIQNFADAHPRVKEKKSISQLAKGAAATVGAGTAIALTLYKGGKWLNSAEGKAVTAKGKDIVKKAWKWANTDSVKKAASRKSAKMAKNQITRVLRSTGKHAFVSFG